MTIRRVRIGSMIDVHQYDDADYSEAIDTEDQPIKIGQSVVGTDAVRRDELPGAGGNIVSAAANIADNAVVRGDGGGKGVQGSNVTIDDVGSQNILTGQGYKVNNIRVVTDQQAVEADAAAVSAIAAGAGADTIDLATFNVDLGTLVTGVNALRTTLNNLLAKLRTHGLINT